MSGTLPVGQGRTAYVVAAVFEPVLECVHIVVPVSPVPEYIPISLVGSGIKVIGMSFKRDLAAFLAGSEIVIGHKQVVVVAVARRYIPAVGPDPHPTALIVHERVVHHNIVVGRLDEQPQPVIDGLCFPAPGDHVIAHDRPVGRPLQEEVGAHVVVKPALLDHVVKVVHVQPEARAIVVREVEVAEGRVVGVEPLATARFPHPDVTFPVVILAFGMFEQAVIAVNAPDAAHAVVDSAYAPDHRVGASDDEAGSVIPLGGHILDDHAFVAGANGAEQAFVGAVAEGDPDQVKVAFDVAKAAMGLVVGGIKEVIGAAGLHQGLVGVLAPGQDGVHRGWVVGRAFEVEGTLPEIAAVVDLQEHLPIGDEYIAAVCLSEGIVGAFVAVPEGVEGPGEAVSIAIRGPGAGDVLSAGDDHVFAGEAGDGEQVAGGAAVGRNDGSVIGAFSDDDRVPGSGGVGLHGALDGAKGLGFGARVGIVAVVGINPKEIVAAGIKDRANRLARA